MIELYAFTYGAQITCKSKMKAVEGENIAQFPVQGVFENKDGQLSNDNLEAQLYVDYHGLHQPVDPDKLEKLEKIPKSDVQLGYQQDQIYLVKGEDILTPGFNSIEMSKERDYFIGKRGDHIYHIHIFKQ